jgi:hypothetical protein
MPMRLLPACAPHEAESKPPGLLREAPGGLDKAVAMRP